MVPRFQVKLACLRTQIRQVMIAAITDLVAVRQFSRDRRVSNRRTQDHWPTPGTPEIQPVVHHFVILT
jgi:hypothetical protein